MENISQMHFEFNQWEQAFKTWDENLPLYGDQMMMVISEQPYCEGYWIEAKRSQLEAGNDTFYRSDEAVQSLKKRVINAIQLANDNGMHCRLVY